MMAFRMTTPWRSAATCKPIPVTRSALSSRIHRSRQSSLHVQSAIQTDRNGVAPPGLRETCWDQMKMTQRFPRLDKHDRADVVVIGAGIAGLTAAYNLAKGGKDVVLLEGKTRGSGQTGKTTAHIMMWHDDYWYELIQSYGLESARLVMDSHVKSRDFIKNVVEQEKIDCDFELVDGYLVPNVDLNSLPIGPLKRSKMEKEFEACQKLGGYGSSVQWVDLGGGQDVGGVHEALLFPDCGDFQPLAYLDGLASACEKMGVRIYEMSNVKEVQDGDCITVDGPVVRAKDAVVLATNSPINRNLAVHARQSAHRSYVIILEIPDNSVKRIQQWDTDQPYHYIRTTQYQGKTVLVVGGGDHLTGIEPEKYPPSFEHLEEYIRARFPQAGKILTRWLGQVYEPNDQLYLHGKDPLLPDGQVPHYIITGDSGQGMTGGTIGGMLVPDLILGRDNPWKDLYNPGRIPAPDIKTPLKAEEEITATVQSYAKVVAPKNLNDVRTAVQSTFNREGVESEVPAGSGAVVQEGTKKVALYREPSGKLHRMSAICPHLACVVEWNPNDSTFDCACHGSQFACTGEYIQGPTTVGLENLDVVNVGVSNEEENTTKA